MLLLTLLTLAQPSLDPVDALDAADPWLRAWAEAVAHRLPRADDVELVLERSVRGARATSRRSAVQVGLSGALRFRGGARREELRGTALVLLRVRWDALWIRPPDERLLLPKEERRRRRRCLRLAGAAEGLLDALAREARMRALGCA
jgi:hypothetical protein